MAEKITDVEFNNPVETQQENTDLNTFFNIVPALLCIASTDGYFKYLNPEWENILGFSLEELLSRPIFDFIHPDDHEPTRREIEWQLNGNMTLNFVNRYLCRNGSYKYIEWRANSAKGDKLYAVARDITERKQAETYGKMGREILQILNETGNLQDSIQHVLNVLKTITGFDAVGIRLQDGEDFPYYVQKGFSKDFLLTENTLIERTTDGGVCRDKDGNVKLECTCGLVISGNTDPVNSLFTSGGSCWTNDSFTLLDIPASKDPRLHPRNHCIHQGYATVALVPIRNQDRIIGLIQLNDRRKERLTLNVVELLEGIASHIGSAMMRKQAEEKLQANRRQLKDIIDFLPDATLAIDKERRVIIWNKEIEKMTGVPAAEMIGKGDYAYTIPFYGEARPQLMDLIFMDNVDIMARYPNIIREGDSFIAEVFCNALYHNKGAWVFLKASPLHDQSGNIIGAIERIRDITERKQAEAEKEKIEDQNRQLQKSESLGRMAGAIAHHFNNQLSAVIGNLELSMLKLSPQDEGVVKNLTAAMQATHKAATISSLMLTYLGKATGKRDYIDISDICHQTLPMLEACLHTNVSLKTDLPSNGPIISANTNQIQQALINLVTNAGESFGDSPGAIHLSVKKVSPEQIFVFHLFPIDWKPQNTSYACVEIADTGCGIANMDIEKIFDPFFSTKFPGRGLGLSVVLGIVRTHGGGVSVESKPEQGSVFRMFLPVSTDTITQ